MRKIEILVPDNCGKFLTELEDLLRFWMKVELGSPQDCWIWKGAMFKEGYGQVRMGTSSWPAHRVAYTDCVGEIPERRKLKILCGNRLCCNPAHLTLS